MKRKPATALLFRAKIIHFPSLQIREFLSEQARSERRTEKNSKPVGKERSVVKMVPAIQG